MINQIGIIIRTYDRYIEFMEPLSKQLKEAGFYVVVGYDAVEKMPPCSAVNACDHFFSGGGLKGKQWGDIHNIRIGLRHLLDEGKEYAFCVNGDAVITQPEKIVDLIDILGEDDVLTTQWHGVCGNIILFGHTHKLREAYEIVPNHGRPQHEKKMTTAFNEIGVKYAIHPCRANNKGTWGLIGYSRSSENYNPG